MPSYVVEELEKVTGKSASEAIKEMVMKFYERRQLAVKYLEIFRIALQDFAMAVELAKKDPRATTLAIAKIASFLRSSLSILRQVAYTEKWSAVGIAALVELVNSLEKEALLSSDPYRGSMSLGGLLSLATALVALIPAFLPLSEKEYNELLNDMETLTEKLRSG